MADSFIQLPPNSTGTRMETIPEPTHGYHRQVVVVADPNVTDGYAPVSSIKGLVVQQWLGSSINVYGNVSVASSIETTLVTYSVPVSKTLLVRGFVGWGDYVGEFLVRVDGTVVGGGRTSAAEPTIQLPYVSPIVANAGQMVTLSATHYAPGPRDMKANLIGELQ